MSLRQLAPLLVALVVLTACSSESPQATGSDAAVDADSNGEPACGASIEGKACEESGRLVGTCDCLDGQGIVLICCARSKEVRVYGCTDKWLFPSCDSPGGTRYDDTGVSPMDAVADALVDATCVDAACVDSAAD